MTFQPMQKEQAFDMKKILIGSFIVCAVTLWVSQIAHAQGTTYLSDLSDGPAGFDGVASDHWVAIGFETGTNASGYVLNSVQLEMFRESGNASGFATTLYTSTTTNPTGSPFNDLGSLVGSDNPSTQGIYTYTASGLTLAASTYYFIVLTAATASATGAYQLGVVGPYNSVGGWNGTFNYYSADDGASWILSRFGVEFAINATAVPEPAAEMFLGCGGILLLALSRGKLGKPLPKQAKPSSKPAASLS